VESFPEYLSLTELAAYVSVCPNTLKKWVDCGMPVYRIGRCIRVKKSEFNAWLGQFRLSTDFKDLDAVWDQVMKEV
jgi:excisionase family DNA binding protein